MKLNKQLVTERENFVRETYRTNTKITGREVLDLLANRYGKRMRLGRLYQLRKEVLTTNNVTTLTTSTTTTETPRLSA